MAGCARLVPHFEWDYANPVWECEMCYQKGHHGSRCPRNCCSKYGTQEINTSLCPKCKQYVTHLDDSDPMLDIEKVGNMNKRQQEGNFEEVDKIKIRKANFIVSEEL
jgi:hypothetical protein